MDPNNPIQQTQQTQVSQAQQTQPLQTETPPVNQSSSENTSGQGKNSIIPPGVKGWSWGAFFWNWIWAISNKVWIGLLVAVPYIGLIMLPILGIKGREWAWQSKHWDSVDHFNKVQHKWSLWGVLIIGTATIFILIAILIVAINPAGR